MEKCLRWIIAILCLSVTATVCASCGGAQAEKTELDAPVIASAVYTGETIRATVPENDGYEIVANEGGIYAGEYDVVLKLSDESKYAWKNPDEGDANKVTLKFAITQADNEITDFAVADVVFGEASVLPVATAKFGTPTFTYSDSANGTFTEAVPSAVGKYFAKATVAAIADYKGADKVVSFRITKKASVFTAEAAAVNGLTYDGSAHALVTAAATADGTVEYKLGEDGEWSESIPEAANAGTYKVFYRIMGDESHADYEVTEPVTVTIAKANATFTAPTAKTDLVYTGSAIELVVAGSATGGEMQYKLGEGEYGTTVPSATDVGTYTVYYKVIGDGNHNDVAEASLTVTIAKANATFTAPTAKTDLVYTGSAIELVVAGSATGGEMQYKLGEGEYGTTVPSATDAGTYTVYYKVIGDGNHNDAAEVSITVTIAKANAEFTAPTAKTDLVYTGSAIELVVAGSATDGEIQYKLGEGEYDTTVPAATNAGTYTVYYKVIGDGNHNDAAEVSITVTIAKAKNVIEFNKDSAGNVTSVDFTYGEDPIQNATATSGEVTYTYISAHWEGDGENKKPVADDGNFAPWNKTNKAGLYLCRMTAGNDNYETVEKDRWVTVYARETDENGVKYEFDETTQTYGVSGYAGSATEVNVPGTFSDGANGEKSVTYVKSDAFKDTNVIKKIVFPMSVTTLKGLAFFGCSSVEYISMAGVTEIGDGGNNLTFCYSLKTLIVHEGLNVTGQLLQSGDDTKNGVTSVYVDGTSKISYNADLNKLIKTVYYKGDGVKCFTWTTNADGTIKAGPAAHNYGSDGKCTVCGEYDTKGVTYAYADGSYYVTGYTGSDTTVTVLGKYNDGVNGEHAVTYVAENCAWGTNVTKIILPDSVTDFKGLAFMSAVNLEYISMTGVKTLTTGNNFLNCGKITTVIVNKDFQLTTQQFKNTGDGAPTIVVYVNGTYAESTFAYVNRPSEGLGNEFLTGVVYYKGDGVKCFTWTTNDDGTIKAGPAAHNYGSDGKCTVCDHYGESLTNGVTYAYAEGKYYVTGYTGSDTTVTVLGTYNDGFNGEHDVAYVASSAFAGNAAITKVILHESVTELKGSVFSGCSALTYVDMRGVTKMSGNNNLLGCFALEVVVIGAGYKAVDQQFVAHPLPENFEAKLALYVYGENSANNAPQLSDNDKLVDRNKIYYYSDEVASGCWNYVDDVATLH